MTVRYDELLAWGRNPFHDIEHRVTDVGWAYMIGTQFPLHSKMLPGAGPLIVVKSTRQVWRFGSAPAFLPMQQATSEQEFNHALRECARSFEPMDEVPRLPWYKRISRSGARSPSNVTFAELVAWGTLYYKPDIERCVTDVGWAFKVDTQPVEYRNNPNNFGAMVFGSGPLIVVKSTRKVWQIGSGPDLLPIHEATSEREFKRALRESGLKLAPEYEIPRRRF